MCGLILRAHMLIHNAHTKATMAAVIESDVLNIWAYLKSGVDVSSLYHCVLRSPRVTVGFCALRAKCETEMVAPDCF